MTAQQMIELAMAEISEARIARADNLRLGDFIRLLEQRPTDQRIAYDFGGFEPTVFDSYRGFYEDLSLNFNESRGNSPTVGSILAAARDAVGTTFTGYKGGNYRMGEPTLLWASRHGETHSTAIVGVTGDNYQTVIETAWVSI